jgi:hypothetical protein
MTDFCTYHLSHEADSLMKQQLPFGTHSKPCTETRMWMNLMSIIVQHLHSSHKHEILYIVFRKHTERGNFGFGHCFILKTYLIG